MFRYHRHFLAVAALVGLSACANEPVITVEPVFDKLGNPVDEGCLDGQRPVPGMAPVQCVPDIPEDRGEDPVEDRGPNDDLDRELEPIEV